MDIFTYNRLLSFFHKTKESITQATAQVTNTPSTATLASDKKTPSTIDSPVHSDTKNTTDTVLPTIIPRVQAESIIPPFPTTRL